MIGNIVSHVHIYMMLHVSVILVHGSFYESIYYDIRYCGIFLFVIIRMMLTWYCDMLPYYLSKCDLPVIYHRLTLKWQNLPPDGLACWETIGQYISVNRAARCSLVFQENLWQDTRASWLNMQWEVVHRTSMNLKWYQLQKSFLLKRWIWLDYSSFIPIF